MNSLLWYIRHDFIGVGFVPFNALAILPADSAWTYEKPRR